MTVGSLTQTAGTGGTTFNSAVILSSGDGLDLTASAVTFVNAATVDTLAAGLGGTVDITNADILTIGTGNFSLDGAFTQDGSAAVTISADITTTGDNISFLRAVTLADAVSLSTGVTVAGNIVLSSTVAGTGAARNLTLVSGSGTTTVADAIGAGNLITTITLQANDAGATGTVTFNGNVTLTGAAATITTFAQAYAVVFNEDVTVPTADVNFLNSGGVTLGNASDDNLTFNGGLGSVAGATTVAGTITTTADDIDIAALTVAANTTITTGAGIGNIAITGTINADDATANDRTLTIVAGTGTATFGNTIGVSQALADFDVTAATITFNTTTVTVDDGAGGATVTLTGAVVLGANVTIDTADNSVNFTSTINADNISNDRTLTITAGTGTVTFGGNVGATAELADFDVTAATINLNAATFRVDDVGGQTVTLTGAVVLGVNTVTIDTDGAAVDNNLTFTSTIDADDAAGQNRTLVITAGGDIVTFGGNVGVSQALADFDVTAATINLNAATFILDDGAAGERTFTGAVVLGANVTIDTNGTADSAINFDTAATTINADNAANDRTLTLDAGTGIVSFDGLVGGGAALADLDVTATTINLNAATFTIDAGGGATVTLTGAVVLGAASLTIDTDGTNDNNLTFTSTINADNISNNRTLTITAGTGTVTFGGNVGATAELADFDVTAATINLNAATFRVDDVGGQTVTLTGAVVLGVNTVTIDTDGALVDNNLTFTSTIDADDAAGQNRTLVITAGDDIVTFGGNVGVSQALADFDVTAATITFNTTTVTVDDGAGGATVTLTGAVVLGGNLTIDTDGTADNSVNFTSTIVADNVANDRTLTVTAGR